MTTIQSDQTSTFRFKQSLESTANPTTDGWTVRTTVLLKIFLDPQTAETVSSSSSNFIRKKQTISKKSKSKKKKKKVKKKEIEKHPNQKAFRVKTKTNIYNIVSPSKRFRPRLLSLSNNDSARSIQSFNRTIRNPNSFHKSIKSH